MARMVWVEATDMPLKNVLQQLFRTTNIGYEVENTSIVLFRKEADKPEGPVTVTGRVVDPAGQRLDYAWGGLEVHVGDPEGNHVRLGDAVPFVRA